MKKRKSSISGGKYELKKLQIHLRKYWQLYLLLLPAFVYVLIFSYGPMYGIIMAFKDYKIGDGIWGSAWVGVKAEAGILGK